MTLTAKGFYSVLTLLELKSLPVAYKLAMYKRLYHDAGKSIPHDLPPLFTRKMYDDAYSYAIGRETPWERQKELDLLKESLYILANFFLRALLECEFTDMPGSYGELIPQFLIKLPDRIPTAIVYAAAYVPLLDAVHRWLEEPMHVFEPHSAIELLVMEIALN